VVENSAHFNTGVVLVFNLKSPPTNPLWRCNTNNYEGSDQGTGETNLLLFFLFFRLWGQVGVF
jgi:hypothetical protein